jgi:hypothetical protein
MSFSRTGSHAAPGTLLDDDALDAGDSLSQWMDELSKDRDAIFGILASNQKRLTQLLHPEPRPSVQPSQIVESAAQSLDPPPTESVGPVDAVRGSYEDVIAKKWLQYPEEPEDGVRIGVQVPEGGKFTRRFAATTEGEQIYIWIASRPEIMRKNLRFWGFELFGPQGTLLEIDKSLLDQGVVRPTMFNVKTIE